MNDYRCVIVRGLPGSGASYLADQAGEATGFDVWHAAHIIKYHARPHNWSRYAVLPGLKQLIEEIRLRNRNCIVHYTFEESFYLNMFFEGLDNSDTSLYEIVGVPFEDILARRPEHERVLRAMHKEWSAKGKPIDNAGMNENNGALGKLIEACHGNF